MNKKRRLPVGRFARWPVQEQANRQTGEQAKRLIPGFVHQLRSPLHAAASTAALLLERKGLPPDLRESLELIRRSAERARDAVKNLLAYTKGEAPVWTYQSINGPVNAACDYLDGIAAARGIRIEKQQTAVLPAVRMQAELLQEAILNYAVNGLEAMQPGGVLTLATTLEDGNVLLRITDTGQGMNLKKFRPGAYKTTKKGGLGLGLVFSAEILRRHDARITFESHPGKGTTVQLHFPPVPDDTPSGLA